MKIKKLIATIALVFVAQFVVAQDVIITQEGDAHKVYELEVGASSVFYKLENSENAALQKMDKSNILMIKYQDGRKQIMGEEENSKPANVDNSTQKQETSKAETEDYTDNVANNAAIEYWNNIDIQYLEGKSNKKANLLYCQCELNNQSKIADKNVELKFSSIINKYIAGRAFEEKSHFFPQGNSFKVSIKNKSTETIYLDLGKCFLIRGSESIQCYVPSVTSNTSGQSIGTSVNMGSVTNAMGVSGALGTLAQGINVGGGKSSSSTTTTFAQRIVPVPPMSEKEIGTIELFPKTTYINNNNTDIYNINYEVKSTFSLLNALFIKFDKEETPLIGESRNLSNTPLLNIGTFVTYSMNEEQSNPQILNATFYLEKIIGLKGKYLNENDLSPNYEDAIFFLAYPKKK